MSIEQNVFTELYFHKEFEKEFKKFQKKWPSLNDDLKTFINTPLKLFHKQNQHLKYIFHISNLGIENPKIYKVKSFACKSLKGTGSNSGIRIIYAHFEDRDRIESIEIYYKGDKGKENRERIKKYYG